VPYLGGSAARSIWGSAALFENWYILLESPKVPSRLENREEIHEAKLLELPDELEEVRIMQSLLPGAFCS
jgi:hypothetical protein